VGVNAKVFVEREMACHFKERKGGKYPPVKQKREGGGRKLHKGWVYLGATKRGHDTNSLLPSF